MSLDRESALRRFASEPVARLATVDSAGQPHLVPVTFALDDGVVFTMVDHKPKKSMTLKRIENIRANPRVTLLADHYEDDWSKLWWVRVDGEATVHGAGESWIRGQRVLAKKYHEYESRPPVGESIAVSIRRVSWWEWPR